MITPEQDEGIKFWGDFFVKPYKLKYAGGVVGSEKYLICDFILIKATKNDPIVLHAYSYWQVDELLKKYQMKNRQHLLEFHYAKLPKDEIMYLEGVLKSTLPADFTGTTIEAAAYRVDEDKGKNVLDKSFSNIICINNMYNKITTNEIISQQFVEIAHELSSRLNMYLTLKEKIDSKITAVANELESNKVIDKPTDENGGKKELLV